jgi:septum formation protein
LITIQIVLASQSARRKQLLGWIIKDFIVKPSNINEDGFKKLARTPEELVVKLAKAKAQKIANDQPKAVIIAADTIVVLPQPNAWQEIGKPADSQHAREMLLSLKGIVHQVYTGICVLRTDTKQIASDFVVSQVQMKSFSDEVLDSYVSSGEPLDKAGGYGIQDVMGSIVQRFEGSYTNIVGLPMATLVELLDSVGALQVCSLRTDWQERVKKETGYDD